MNSLDYLREYSFKLIDLLRGRKLKKHYDDIKFILDNYSNPKSIKKREKYLKNILNHAVLTTDFYKKYKNFNSIKDFPVINRNIINDNKQIFKSSTYINKKKYKVFTSGSTGVPFQTLHNLDKCYRHKADIIYFGEKAGFELGRKLIYFRIWPKKRITNWFTNVYKYNVLDITDSDREKMFKMLRKDKSKKGLLGYSSAFERLCIYLDSVNASSCEDCNINSIIAMSERLNDYTKKSIKKYFNRTIVSRYSNMELGLMAQEEIDNEGRFKINSASYFVEIFDMDEDKPVENGVYGRIVVTDLFNYAVPFIRYDTGDVAKIEYYKNLDGFDEPYLVSVQGKKMDLIHDTKGKLIPSQVSAYIFKKHGDYKQFQFEQCGEKQYIVRLNTDKKLVNEKALLNDYKNLLGDDANIKIEYVDGIPLLGSGKKKEVLNTYLSK